MFSTLDLSSFDVLKQAGVDTGYLMFTNVRGEGFFRTFITTFVELKSVAQPLSFTTVLLKSAELPESSRTPGLVAHRILEYQNDHSEVGKTTSKPWNARPDGP